MLCKVIENDVVAEGMDLAHARQWCQAFFDWYANRHRHSALALFTPADVFFNRIDSLAPVRQAALDKAFASHPERFVNGAPRVRRPPTKVALNPIDPGAPCPTVQQAIDAPEHEPAPRATLPLSVVTPGAPPRTLQTAGADSS